MGMAFTEGGYNLFDVISALQKSIRRADEEQAMYWALELVPRYEAYLWRRLVVIANEDIGIANTHILLLVSQQRESWMEFRAAGKDSSARLVLANTILAMCRSPKSRLADEFQCTVHQDRLHGKKLEVPDYAYDKHTGRGKNMGRGPDHWLDVGCVLNPPEIDNTYSRRARAWWTSPDFKQVEWKKGKGAPDDDSVDGDPTPSPGSQPRKPVKQSSFSFG